MKFNILTFIAIIAMAMTFTSCGEDAIQGCMDPLAENYDSTATEGDGNCVFTRDKFLGTYQGDLSCPGALMAISNPDFEFIITESVDGGVEEVDVTLVNLGATINGTVNGDVIALATTIPMFPFGGGFVKLEITGSATLDADGTMMTGQLDLTGRSLETNATLASDSCSFSGVKQ